MTLVDSDVISRVEIELKKIMDPEFVLTGHETILYEYDGSVERARPDVVVVPSSTQEVMSIMQIAARYSVPVVARGAGTSLSGGAIPLQRGIVLSTTRMNKIIDVDLRNRRAVVQPGVINLDVSAEVNPQGFQYTPDPSSQKASTIGGNVATNAGGPHTLAYGVTTNHVLGLEFVTGDGRLVKIGGISRDVPGYDLVGLMVGSEGTLGVVTAITVNLMRIPESVRTMLVVFDSVDGATQTVSRIIAEGIIPAAMELMDQGCTRAVSSWMPEVNLPTDAGAVLILEVEGVEAGLDEDAERIVQICNDSEANEVRLANSDLERGELWAARKGAFGAIGVLSPNYYVQDGVVPRTRLAEVQRRVNEIGRGRGLQIVNVFHAGDGNIHPIILFDSNEQGALDNVMEAGEEILDVCIEAGGTLTGEHGLGMEKNKQLPRLLSRSDIDAMLAIKDIFSPNGLLNPQKVFPPGMSCRLF